MISECVDTNKYSIQVLGRAMLILDTFLDAREPLKLEQLCIRTGLPKSTTFRVVTNLIQGGYLEDTDDGFWPGLKMMRFGSLVEDNLDVTRQALPLLRRLRDQFNETIHLGVLDNELRVVYLEKHSTRQAVGLMASRVGGSSPFYCTGLGKAMAAYQPSGVIRNYFTVHNIQQFTARTITRFDDFEAEMTEVRRRGYAIDDAEHEDGVRCLAAPIWDRNRNVIAAISISGPDYRMPNPLIGSAMAEQLLRTSQLISMSLGYMPEISLSA